MIIELNREDILKLFKWWRRRKVKKSLKKHQKRLDKNPELKKEWDDFVDEIDNFMAYGEKGGNKVKDDF